MIELLVVIAVIGMISSLLLPALAKAKSRGQSISCANNVRQLHLACVLYTHDHSDLLPYNFGANETKQAVQRKLPPNWVNNVLSWELDADNTNRALITEAALGSYGANPGILRCPSDWVLSGIQKAAGWQSRTRSISMNAMVGNAGEFSSGGTNVNNPAYQQFLKLSTIPNPANIFVFIEEHPDSINDGYFLNRKRELEWVDLPASYHDGAANISFADGHVQSHAWHFPRTKPPAKPEVAELPLEIPAAERADWDWLMYRTSVYVPAAR